MVDPSENPRIQELLEKYSERRTTVEGYIGEMEHLKSQVSSLFPDKLDHRAKFVLEEKIKASASFFATLLALTQEYNKTIMSEIDILRKLAMGGNNKERDMKEVIAYLEENNPELVAKLTEEGIRQAEQSNKEIEEYELTSPEDSVDIVLEESLIDKKEPVKPLEDNGV